MSSSNFRSRVQQPRSSSELAPPSAPSIPGSRQWPVLGHPGALRGLLPFMERQQALHGDIFRMRVLRFRAIGLAHPEHMQHVLLGQRANYVKGDTYDSTRNILGDGLLTLDGPAWKGRRALAQPAFHRQALERLAAIMSESGARFFAALSARVTPDGQVLDAHREMVKLTLEVVIASLFGAGTLDSGEVSYQALGDALELLSEGVNGVRLPDWIPTPHNRKFKRTVRELDRNVYQIIEAGRALSTSNGSLLSMLLDARDGDGNALPNKAVRDEVITMFVAGHETSALTLTWLFTLLAGRQDVLNRMQEEVERVLGGRDPRFDDLPQLVYVRQVIDETLRLRPAAPMIARNALGDDQLGQYAVRAGEIVLPFFWGLHRHPDYWSAPQRFDPDRFAPEHAKTRHPWCYLPFSGGPRSCIGNMFALTEMTIMLAQLLNRFELAVLPCDDVKPVAIGTTRPSKPVYVKFTPRR